MTDLQTDQLRLMAETFPDKVAYINLGDGAAITFDRWERQSNRLAHGLADRGVGKGDLVGLYLEAERILDFIVAYSAVHKLGAVAVPMNYRLSPAEAGDILDHAEVSAVVTSGSFGEAAAAAVRPAPVPPAGGHGGREGIGRAPSPSGRS